MTTQPRCIGDLAGLLRTELPLRFASQITTYGAVTPSSSHHILYLGLCPHVNGRKSPTEFGVRELLQQALPSGWDEQRALLPVG